MARSYKPEVTIDSSGKWSTNALRFATEAEAQRYAADLAMRWTVVIDYRATPCDDPVNYAIIDNKLELVNPAPLPAAQPAGG